MHHTDYNFRPKDCLLGAQMLFVAFGALVLVPLPVPALVKYLLLSVLTFALSNMLVVAYRWLLKSSRMK